MSKKLLSAMMAEAEKRGISGTILKQEHLESGLEDDPDAPARRICNHPEHNPPHHYVVPEGKRFRNVCPGCGFVSYLYPSQRGTL